MNSVTEDQELVKAILAEAGEKLSSDKPGFDFEHSLLLAKMAVAVKNTEDVKKYYRYCLNVNRKSALTVFNELGQYLMDEDLYGEAETVFQEAINDPVLSGGKPHFLFQLSQALEMQGKTEQAIAAIGLKQNHSARITRFTSFRNPGSTFTASNGIRRLVPSMLSWLHFRMRRVSSDGVN